jgi:hypothetical protein
MVEGRRVGGVATAGEQEEDTWRRRQIGWELREEQRIEAKKREIDEETSMRFNKAERDVRYSTRRVS